MLRARRLVSAVVVASLAGAGLSACGLDRTAVAARIGTDRTITERDVQEIWDETQDSLPDAGPSAEPARVPYSRSELVQTILSRELYGRLAEKKGVAQPAAQYDQLAAQLQLPATDRFVRLFAETSALQNELVASITSPTPPTEKDLQDVFDRISANGGLQGGTDFTAFSSMLTEQDKTALSAALVVRNDLLKLADELDIEVSPRYQPVELGLLGTTNQSTGQSYAVVAAALGENVPVPVSDVS